MNQNIDELFQDVARKAAHFSPLRDFPDAQPHSIISSRGGNWQDRKRDWMRIGIASEVGREKSLSFHIPTKAYNPDNREVEYYGENAQRLNTSIFDPVLCEVVYRWFCPKGGQIVDPFAGGSVRGIVAAKTERRYWGCDLRAEQIQANIEQADSILGDKVEVTVSAAMLRQEFHPCELDFVRKTCSGRCCESSDGIMVTVHSSEAAKFEAKGAKVERGFIVADGRGKCPFKQDDGLCGVHDDKPLGCRFSPFTLSAKNTLIVRNRYRLLKCYKCSDGKLPAYKAHRWSLVQIFGEDEAERITKHLDDGSGDLVASMPASIHAVMCDNDAAKGNERAASTRPVWVCGDSSRTLVHAPEADFIFSCPPYGDLEKYSDDPSDLSNMAWDDFVEAYNGIIKSACARLKNDRFACFVIGDFRDDQGHLRNFVGKTTDAFVAAGLKLYNEAIFVTPVASASMRVTKQFEKSRKFAKTHQNILVFVKGDHDIATKAINESQQS